MIHFIGPSLISESSLAVKNSHSDLSAASCIMHALSLRFHYTVDITRCSDRPDWPAGGSNFLWSVQGHGQTVDTGLHIGLSTWRSAHSWLTLSSNTGPKRTLVWVGRHCTVRVKCLRRVCWHCTVYNIIIMRRVCRHFIVYNYEMVIIKPCRSPFGIQTCIPFVYKIVLDKQTDRQT